MHTFSQWLHQHSFLLMLGAVFAALGLWLGWRRRWAGRLALGGAWLVVMGALWVGLRTPAATVAEHRARSLATPVAVGPAYAELALDSVAAIQATIAGSGKPTLVEVYSDYGIS